MDSWHKPIKKAAPKRHSQMKTPTYTGATVMRMLSSTMIPWAPPGGLACPVLKRAQRPTTLGLRIQ